MIMWVIWAIGLGISVYAIASFADAIKQNKLDSFSNTAMLFPALCGFAVFPIINIVLGALALVALHDAISKKPKQ